MVAIPIVAAVISGRTDVRDDRRRAASDAGPAQPAVRAPAVDVAPLLHRHADRRAPVAVAERRRRRSERRHEHRLVGALEHRHRAQLGRRDDRALMAADDPVARRRAGVRLPDVPRRPGPAPDLRRDAAVPRRAVGADGGDAVGLRDPARQGLRPATRRGRALPEREPPACADCRCGSRWSAAASSPLVQIVLRDHAGA